MTISFDIPRSLEDALRRARNNPNDLAREALLVDLYRRGVLSHGELADTLGISRPETDIVLTRHGVVEDLLSPAELQEQLAALRKLVGR